MSHFNSTIKFKPTAVTRETVKRLEESIRNWVAGIPEGRAGSKVEQWTVVEDAYGTEKFPTIDDLTLTSKFDRSTSKVAIEVRYYAGSVTLSLDVLFGEIQGDRMRVTLDCDRARLLVLGLQRDISKIVADSAKHGRITGHISVVVSFCSGFFLLIGRQSTSGQSPDLKTSLSQLIGLALILCGGALIVLLRKTSFETSNSRVSAEWWLWFQRVILATAIITPIVEFLRSSGFSH